MAEKILSVGIDIGTSTTQLVFSYLTIENVASAFNVPRIIISDKEVVHESNIIKTPLLKEDKVDGESIQAFVEAEYERANIEKETIQTGAVIITGETARKENAEEVLQGLSGFAGDFVVATAGPDLESVIAAKGAGMHTYSKNHSVKIVNLDIGGGTSNLAVMTRGKIVDTGCLDIGGRLVKINQETHKIDYISDKIRGLIKDNGWSIEVGQTATKEQLQPLVDRMAELLEESVGLKPATDQLARIATHKTIKATDNITHISFTGGVAEAIYKPVQTDVFKYGDVGLMLGEAIAKSSLTTHLKLVEPTELIRATVVGAGSHTTEISGSTITYSENEFPVKNVPVIKLQNDELKDPDVFASIMKEKLQWFDVKEDNQKVAISFPGDRHARFADIVNIAESIVKGMTEYTRQGLPLIVVTENDIAKVLGQSLRVKMESHQELICVDSVFVEEGDYIDIGHPVASGSVLPVVIKTLVFN